MNVKLMLDASRENDCPDGFLVVESEIEFLRFEGGERPLFVRGELLCHWARELYRARRLKEDLDYVELPSPRNRLRLLIGDWATGVQADVLAHSVDLLKKHPNITRSGLLARLTGKDFWAEAPSREHAARWLLAEFSADLMPLIEATRELWVRDCVDESLGRLYQVPLNERQVALKEWLSADDESVALGLFPIAVAGEAAKKIRELWAQKLRGTGGQATEKFSAKNPNASLIAREAYDYFRYRRDHLTPGVMARIGSMLLPSQRSHLERLVPRDVPEPLPVAAGEQEALAWAVQHYLTYREWQVGAALNEEAAVQAAEELADSFSDWLLENYPRLTMKSYEDSPLNIRGKYVVKELSKSYQVLWVVVDGLNYL